MKVLGSLVFGMCFFALLSGCSDDSVTPTVKTELRDLAGAWEGITTISGDTRHALTDNNVFWNFSSSGEFCSLFMTAYGSYYTGSTGEFSEENSILTETDLHAGVMQWNLTLSAGADTLWVDGVDSGDNSDRGWIFVSAIDAPDSNCFGD